ncbi:MAG: sugar kinase [Flavobacteriales bacterium]|nr:sugar kinase [Flavobacteriales bacterium]
MNKIVCFGEVLVRLSTNNALRFNQSDQLGFHFGGSEANVAKSLSQFNLDTSFITRLPNNELSKCAIQEFQKYGVETGQCVYGGQRLGIYFLEQGAMQRASSVIYDRSHSGMASLEKGMIDWDHIFKDASWFHWSGITPALSFSAAQAVEEALEEAKKRNLIISCDLNYRSKLWDYGKKPSEILPKLMAYSNVLLAGINELSVCLDIEPKEKNETITDYLEDLYKALKKKFPSLEHFASTLRMPLSSSHHKWSGVLVSNGALKASKTYDLTNIVDRIGGGDSFMAGLIYGLIAYRGEPQKIVDFATAASVLKHSIHGDVNMCEVEEVLELMNQKEPSRVKR